MPHRDLACTDPLLVPWHAPDLMERDDHEAVPRSMKASILAYILEPRLNSWSGPGGSGLRQRGHVRATPFSFNCATHDLQNSWPQGNSTGSDGADKQITHSASSSPFFAFFLPFSRTARAARRRVASRARAATVERQIGLCFFQCFRWHLASQ